MKIRPVSTAAAIALVTFATASTSLSRAQTAQTVKSPPQVTITLQQNLLTLTAGEKTITVKAERIISEVGEQKGQTNSSRLAMGSRMSADGAKDKWYRLSGDYHIVNSEGWEWTGHDAELRLTSRTASPSVTQNWIVINAIGPMHQRSPATAPDGTKTFKERAIADKPVPPGAFAGVSFDVDSSTYLTISGNGGAY